MTAPAWPEPPAGFVVLPAGAHALYVERQAAAAIAARGFDDWEAWERGLAKGATASGRGATVVVAGGSDDRWRLKAMRRGGWLAAIWRGRYPSTQRLVATLAASVEARARGVPTAAPVALIVASGFGGLARGAMAFAEIEDAEDLAHKMVRGAATRADLAATIDAVRAMHDVGVCHPDLNLGNILLRPGAGGPPETFIIDFDRATFTPGPLPFGARQAAVRRLERSCAKLTGAPGPFGPGTEDFWYTAYSGDDVELARRLAFGRPAGRLTLALHRLHWRKKTP